MKIAHDWVSIDGWLHGSAERIYKMLSGDNEKKNKRSNSMRQMRAAFGLPSHNEAIPEWLRYWDSLSSEDRIQLRRMDLSTLSQSDIPSPSPQPRSTS